jgi:hypothetical protein
MGVPSAIADAFYGNPNLSPTDKAIIVAELMSMGATSGREIFVAGAANAQSIEMGFFYRRQAELIAGFDQKVAPVSAFVRMGGAPMLQTGKGTVSVLPRSTISIGRPRSRGWSAAPVAARCGSRGAPATGPRPGLPRSGGRFSPRRAPDSASKAHALA